MAEFLSTFFIVAMCVIALVLFIQDWRAERMIRRHMAELERELSGE